MARVYRSPFWLQSLSIVLTLAIYVYPLYLFFQHPERASHITRVFILFPLLCLLFLFTPIPDATTPSQSTPSLYKPLAIITLINGIFFFLSQTLIPSFIFITTQTTIYSHSSLNHEWLALWTLFSLYTATYHYFAHREQKAPLASASLYACKNSYAAIVLARIFAMFASFSQFMLIYFIISVAMLLIFRLHGTLAIGFNPLVILGCIFVLLLSTVLVTRFSRLVSLPFRLQNRYYLLLTTIPSGIVLYHFYSLSIPYLTEEGLIHTLYQAFAAIPPCINMIPLSEYGFFLLAMPFASGFILRYSKQLSTKTVLTLIMTPVLAFDQLGSLSLATSTTLSIIAVLVAVYCVFLGTCQKTTADFLIGPFLAPRQRYIVANRSSKLFLSHLIGPMCMVTMTLNFGLQPMMGLLFIAGISVMVVTCVNIAGFYGRIMRLTQNADKLKNNTSPPYPN